jgi:uncharacterized OB-fold protein
VPAVDGWFTLDDEPRLLGRRCTTCATFVFPPVGFACPNPACTGTEFDTVELSRTGTVWSWTVNRYQPPPPYVAPTDPFGPFAIAAVELADEKLVVLGQVAGSPDDALHVGQQVELVLDTLFADDEHTYVIFKWRAA